MGIKGAWTRPEVLESAVTACSLQDALQAAAPGPATILVDAGCFYNVWTGCIATAVGQLPKHEFCHDFVALALKKATAEFHQNVNTRVQELARHARQVVVCWDNSMVVALAKQAEHEMRLRRQEEGKALFIFRLQKLNTKSRKCSVAERTKRQRELASVAKHIFGPPPLPLDACEEVGIPHGRIVHIKACDEADLLVARLEQQVQHPVVISEDSDFIALVNCKILRFRSLRRNEFQVFCGRRSAREIVLAQLVGQDYTAHTGITGLGWKVAERAMDAISGPGLWQQDGDALALCERVLGQIGGTDVIAGDAVRRAVKVWVARSHEGNTAPVNLSMPSSASLRKQARGVDIASVSLTLPSEIVTGKRSGVGKARLPSAASIDKVPLSSLVKQRLGNNHDPLVKKAIVKQETDALKMRFAREKRQTSRRLGHESHCLPDVCVLPTKREVPQAFFATRGWDEDSEGGHEDDGEGAGGKEGGGSEGTTPSNPAIILRRPARNPGGRTELGHVYPRRTHKDDIHILVNRFKRAPPLVGYEFPRASHPFITLMQTRVLAYKTACNLLSKCLRVYLDHLFHFKENHHLIRQRFRDTMGVKSFLEGLIYLFSRPGNQMRVRHDDTSSAELRLMGRTLSIEEQSWTARSKTIDYAMICTRRFLQLQGEVVEMPKALLFSDMAINGMCAAMELNVRGMVRRRVKACIKHFFPLLSEPVQSILEERLLRDSKDLWMSLTANSLPPDVNVATFAHLLCHRDECLAIAAARTPAEHLDMNAGCLPLAFWCDSLSQLTPQVQDSVAISFAPAYWGISGSYDMRTMLRNGSKDMRALQEYNRRTVWDQVKSLPNQYLNGTYVARHGDWLSGPSAIDIRWHTDPEWDAQFNCFIDHVVVTAGHAYYGTVEDVTSTALQVSVLGSASTVPTLYLLDSVFSIKRIPKGHILSGVIQSDGHALCLGMFHVERGHRTLLSNGAASVLDVLLAEGKHSAVIGHRPQAAGAALGDEEESDESALDLRSALLRLPSIARLKQDRTLMQDSRFHGEFETRRGLPKYLKHVKTFASPAETPRRLIGIDSGEVRENKLVDTVRDSVGVMSRVSSLEFSSKPARAARKRRAARAARVRAAFPLKLDKMLQHMGQSDVYNAAKTLFESSQSVRQHHLKAYAQDKVRYSRMLAQTARFLLLDKLTPLQRQQEDALVLIGSAYTPRQGVAVGSGNIFLCKLVRYLRRHVPKYIPLLSPEAYTSRVCPDPACCNGPAGRRSLLAYPKRCKRPVLRLLYCEHCRVIRDRDTVGALNIIFNAMHVQLYGRQAWMASA